MIDISSLNFEKGGGLVTVVAQDYISGSVLMVAHADREALEKSIATGEMYYRSRTRGLWHKGATSGNVQRLRELRADCDGDAVLALVQSDGPACHTGSVTCFGSGTGDTLARLENRIAERHAALLPDSSRGAAEVASPGSAGAAENPASQSYTQRLLNDRNLRLKKLGEECAELIAACADGDSARAAEEAADLIYHVAVALQSAGASLAAVRSVLTARER